MFFKILERIMYNRLYSYLTLNNILFHKKLEFRAGHSTEHALLELVDQISNTFNDKNYLLGIFIDLSKAFDTVGHKILIQKLEHYGRNGKNLSWFKNYLTNQKQYIQYDSNNNSNDINNNNNNNNNKNRNSNFEKTELLDIICGVPQGSILGPLPFILYINDLYIMFADDTNVFCLNKKIKPLFLKSKISEWFRANKLSLNVDKTRFTLFHRPQDRDNLPLQLPALKINDYEIKRSFSIKFLGILMDEHLSWIDHINTLENKLSKNLGFLYKAKPFLNAKALKSLYFSFFHSYLTYGNIAWCSTLMTKLKKIFSKQKQAIKAISMTSLDYQNLKSEKYSTTQRK